MFHRDAQAQADKCGASLRERFMAWWEGYDLGEPAPALEPEPKVRHAVRYEPPRQHWETSRLRLVQDVWGEGFSSPGGPEYILSKVKLFGLDPAMTVIDLGAGLGGAARTMCEKFGVWVTGFEADEDLAEAAMGLSVKAGMGEKVPIEAFDPEEFHSKAKSLDCVFSKEFLFTVEDKVKFLQAVEQAMKPKAQLLFTDYVLAKPHLHTPVLDSWIEHERRRAHPWAVEDYQDVLAELRLDIRVAEDVTKPFRAMVIKGWADFIESTRRGSVGRETAPALVDEVELWTRRIQAIDAGDLKVCRVHAIKKDTERMMSDW